MQPSSTPKALAFLLAISTVAASSCKPTIIGGSQSSSNIGSSIESSTSLSPWTVEDGESGATVIAYAIAIDSSKNLYVTGYTTAALDGQTLHGTKDLFIAKYSSLGTRLWTVEDGAVNGTTAGHGIATDSTGDVYVSGVASQPIDGQSTAGTFLSKYTSGGSLIWTSSNGVAATSAAYGGVAIGSSGKVYVAGSWKGTYGTSHPEQVYLAQYSSSGAQEWSVYENYNYPESANAIALDLEENIYITGGKDEYQVGAPEDLYIEKYNSSGTLQWSIQDPTGELTQGQAIVADASGNIYIAGQTTAALDGQDLQGTQDLFLTRYNTSGVRQWTIEDGSAGGTASALGLALNSSGELQVTGYTNQGIDGQTLHGTQDLLLSTYTPGGIRQWTIEDGIVGATVSGYAIVTDSSNNYFVVGTTTEGLDGQALLGLTDFFIKAN